jgi:formylglycine-generating enzyme required for sulfatase activity
VDRSGWEETALMAAELAVDRDGFVDQLAAVNLPLAGQCAATLAPRINTFVPLAERLLARMRDPQSDLRARIAAGKALGEMQALEVLGYQSLTDANGKRIVWLPPSEPIPGGEYRFGSRDDPEAYDNEHPFNHYLEPFRLGRYPVTNAEWDCFLRAGGYVNAELWQG